MKFSLNSLAGDQLTVLVLNDCRPAEDWLRCSIRIAAGAWVGIFDAYFKPYRFRQFRNELDALAETNEGVASFVTIENQLEISVRMIDGEMVVAECVANDHPGGRNRLNFALSFNSSDFFPVLRDQLLKIEAAFPPDSPVT